MFGNSTVVYTFKASFLTVRITIPWTTSKPCKVFKTFRHLQYITDFGENDIFYSRVDHRADENSTVIHYFKGKLGRKRIRECSSIHICNAQINQIFGHRLFHIPCAGLHLQISQTHIIPICRMGLIIISRYAKYIQFQRLTNDWLTIQNITFQGTFSYGKDCFKTGTRHRYGLRCPFYGQISFLWHTVRRFPGIS